MTSLCGDANMDIYRVAGTERGCRKEEKKSNNSYEIISSGAVKVRADLLQSTPGNSKSLNWKFRLIRNEQVVPSVLHAIV